MSLTNCFNRFKDIGILLRGDAGTIRIWTQSAETPGILTCIAVILVGAGCYGATMGAWRDPLQALYVGIKFPLIILLTAIGNAVLNGMLAPLLGVNISLRQSFIAILMSFTIASAILGSFSPLTVFLIWNAPPLSGQETSWTAYFSILLTHVFVIGLAGVAANLRLLQLLSLLSGSVRLSRRLLFAWLAGNLFLGSQLSWILRPFIGSPNMPVEFLRVDAFNGNFYESVFRSTLRLISFD